MTMTKGVLEFSKPITVPIRPISGISCLCSLPMLGIEGNMNKSKFLPGVKEFPSRDLGKCSNYTTQHERTHQRGKTI